MSWSEQTIIQPSAWSPRVEWDLLKMPQGSIYSGLRDAAAPPDLERYNQNNWTEEEFTRAGSFEAEYAAVCAAVRETLATAPHVPHTVTLSDSGPTIVVTDLAELEDQERHLFQRPVSGGATTPKFASAPVVGSGLVPATLDTSLTAPTNVTTLVTGSASGYKIEEIIVQGVGTTVAAVVNLFLYDSATYHLYDQFLITAVTSSTTAVSYRALREFTNLLLLNASWSLRSTVTVAGDQSMLKVTVTGGDLA
jgi:hypothetical protein